MNNKIKVLIGDDSAECGICAANKLRENGLYAYTRKKDCSILYDAIRNDAPDVAVIDISSQNGDAISIMKKTKETCLKSPVFIITSSYDNEFIERQVMEAGASYYLLKPYSADDLFSAIKSAIQNKFNMINDDMEIVVTDIIHQLGVPAHIKGYHYLRTAILYYYSCKKRDLK